MARRRSSPTPAKLTSEARRVPDAAIWIGLLVAIFAVYWQVGSFDFVSYDDDLYAQNSFVQSGLTAASLKWAFTAVVSNNWIPVTLLSHLIDGQLFGEQSGMHHLMNVFIHALATVMLFFALRRATGSRWPSAFVACLFGLHPVHTGSVAWVAERKDVLSALFWFLALYLYVRYVEKPDARRYLWMAAAFTLGLLAKPMMVTFPFVLLLFDWWPLGRKDWTKLVREKLPLVGLSIAASAVTYFVQSRTGAVIDVPLSQRIGNAMVSYVIYLGQMFWPAKLAVIYPYAQSILMVAIAAAFILLVGVSSDAVAIRRRHPYLLTGWFWFLGTLVPVIGIVQVGLQAHADRYTYLPFVGLFIVLAWAGAEIVERWPQAKTAMVAAAAVCCVACMAEAWIQLPYWRNSETLFAHAISVTENNWPAEYNLGQFLMNQPGRDADAITHFQAALRIKPDYAEAHNNLGATYTSTGEPSRAIPEFEAALKIRPEFADAHFNLGLALSKLAGRTGDALREYQAAARIDPRHEKAQTNLGVLLVNQGRAEEAIPYLKAAAEIRPSYENEYNLGAVLSRMPGHETEATAHLEAAQRLRLRAAAR